jgi:hypothetical protein
LPILNNDALSRIRTLSSLVATTVVVVACGGGSDAPAPPPPPPPPPASVNITGKAVDGALQGATACYDVNDNKACDGTEPTSVATGVDGGFTIPVLATEAGKHLVIVNVPATAIDADTGLAVGKAFTLVAPATGNSSAQSVFVSPLTTLVQQQVDSTGQTVAQATSFVQTQLGLAVSPLADFTASASAANTTAANAARLVQLTQTQQATAVAAAVGQTDLSGGTVTQADVDKSVAKAVFGALPVIGAAAADPALAGLSGTALQTALNTAATTVVASTGLTATSVVVAVGIAKLPVDATVTTPDAGAAMAALQYTDANNWFMRVNQSTALDNTPDANGLLRFYDVRTRMQPYAYQNTLGVAESFAQGSSKDRAGDLHWSGTAWVACTLGQRNTQTARDAQGRSTYKTCDNYFNGVTTRAAVDIAGQSMATVVANKILPVVGPGTYTGGGGGNGWNLNTAVLGTATFPAGSKLFLQTDVGTENAPAYDARPVNQVAVFSAAVAAGGDARAGTVACQTSGTAVPTASLEEMVARNPGSPCIFNAQTNADGTSLNPREAWGLSTVSLGNLANGKSLPTGTGNYYTTTARLRVGFGTSGNATTYYSCYERKVDGSAQNCSPIGTGTYSITTLSDARTMTFNNLPLQAQALSSARVFVERGGKVYFGFRNPVGIETPTVRLNLVAAQAVTFQLGLPRVQPADTPKPLTGGKATTAATLKGVWGGADATGALIFRFGDNGEFLMADISSPGGGGRPGLEKGWLDYDSATGKVGVLLAIDTNAEWGLSHPAVGEGITSITSTAITYVGGSLSRFTDDPNSIVGMWAVNSATDLTAPHFIFFANGKVASIHPYSVADREPGGACDLARQGPPGIEWSDYTFNATTGALRIFNKIYDTNGCGGVFDSSDGAVANGTANTEANFVVTLSTDRKTATVPEPGGTAVNTLYRIATQ